MLGELVIFAVILVALQMVMALAVTFILMKVFTSKKYLKKMVKMTTELSMEIAEEMLEKED